MVPSARVSDVRTMGEGKHARFSLHSGAHRALGVAFGRSELGVGDEDPVDAAVRLEVNHWNGSVEPRVVLRELYPLEEAARGVGRRTPAAARKRSGGSASRPSSARDPARAESPPVGEASRRARSGRALSRRRLGDRGDRRARLERRRRARGLRRRLAAGGAGQRRHRPARFNGGAALIACHRCGARADRGLAARASGGLALTDYAALGAEPEPRRRASSTSSSSTRPRRSRRRWRGAAAARRGRRRLPAPRSGPRPSVRFALAGAGRAVGPRARRSPASSGPCARRARRAGAELREALAGGGAAPARARGRGPLLPGPARARISLQGEPDAGAGVVGVVSSEGTDLERSAAFRAYSDRYSEAQQFLERPKQP